MGYSSSDPRIFIVDDEQVFASTLTAILKTHGFSATFFTSPIEALTSVRLNTPVCSHPTSRWGVDAA